MDIDQVLSELREMINRLDAETDPESVKVLADSVVSLFQSLDGWVTCYGYLPMAWRQR